VRVNNLYCGMVAGSNVLRPVSTSSSCYTTSNFATADYAFRLSITWGEELQRQRLKK